MASGSVVAFACAPLFAAVAWPMLPRMSVNATVSGKTARLIPITGASSSHDHVDPEHRITRTCHPADLSLFSRISRTIADSTSEDAQARQSSRAAGRVEAGPAAEG
jgi:hypothetical protein